MPAAVIDGKEIAANLRARIGTGVMLVAQIVSKLTLLE